MVVAVVVAVAVAVVVTVSADGGGVRSNEVEAVPHGAVSWKRQSLALLGANTGGAGCTRQGELHQTVEY